MHAVPVPAARALVRFVACVILDGCEYLPCVGAGIVDSGAVHFPAAGPLVWCDNSAAVPVESSLSPLTLPLAERMHVVPVPAALGPISSAVRVILDGYENLLCAGAGIADFDAARFPVLAQLGWDVPAAILA